VLTNAQIDDKAETVNNVLNSGIEFLDSHEVILYNLDLKNFLLMTYGKPSIFCQRECRCPIK
jgi:hypothetical protein